MKNRVRELRSAGGWSQADLASVLGVSRQTVNSIETGRYLPSLPLAIAIARNFDASVEDIFIADQQEQS
jgi:putative transcriptional regulator